MWRTYRNFVHQLRSGIIHVWQLAEPLQEVIPSRYDFSPLELFALAGLLHEYQLPNEVAVDIGSESPAAFHRLAKALRGLMSSLLNRSATGLHPSTQHVATSAKRTI